MKGKLTDTEREVIDVLREGPQTLATLVRGLNTVLAPRSGGDEG